MAFFRLLGFVCFLLLASCNGTEPPRARAGVLDLSRQDFGSGSSSVPLKGEWGARWNRLLSPHEIPESSLPDTVFAFPGYWNDARHQGRAIGAFACGTFTLEILLPDTLRHLAIEIPDVLTASRLYANGELIAENGRVGSSRESTVARAANHMSPFAVEPIRGRVEIVYQIANFESDQGGMSYVPRIGTLQAISREDSLRMGKEVFLIGVLLLLGIYHLLLLAMRRDDRTLLPLAMVCLLWAFRFFVEQGSGHRWITGLWPDLPFSLLARLEVIPFYLNFAVSLHFFCNYFPGLVGRGILRLYYAIVLSLTAVVVLTPPWIFGRLLPLGEVLGVVSVAYAGWIFLRAIRERREGSILLAVGCAAFILACCNSLVVARRYSRAFLSLSAHSEELRRMDRIKDDFLANTSHELRTPLHGIIGMSESILSVAGDDLHEAVRGDVLTIAGSAKRLTNLVNDIMDFSKLRHGDISLEKRPVDCAPMVAQVVANFRPEVGRKGIALRSELPQDLPPVLADEDRLVQILFNLVGNAVKFTDVGEVVVSLVERDGVVEVDVRDSGIGIEPVDRDRIFDAFEQGNAPRRGGTGLGLSISRRLVELHGGKLSVDSQPGLGSTFLFALPVAEVPAGDRPVESGGDRARLQDVVVESAQEESAPLETPSLRGSGAVVLAVDDEPVNLRILRNHLASRGYQVACAQDGQGILERIQREKPALVLLDVMMPGRDGFEVCREIRSRHSASELPVLFVTARNRMDDLLRGYSAGGNDYILKPFLREELLARVDLHLRQRKAYGTLLEESALAGEIMQAVLRLWEELTQGNRADFAEASGLWTVRADPDGWRRTQTLDKYLDPSKTPRQPRWSKVQESVRYVLDLAERAGRGEERAGKLRELVSQLGQASATG
jgi:two-component system, sensor histidine kinase ChiS